MELQCFINSNNNIYYYCLTLCIKMLADTGKWSVSLFLKPNMSDNFKTVVHSGFFNFFFKVMTAVK